mgnify:CR=1 FL=1
MGKGQKLKRRAVALNSIGFRVEPYNEKRAVDYTAVDDKYRQDQDQDQYQDQELFATIIMDAIPDTDSDDIYTFSDEYPGYESDEPVYSEKEISSYGDYIYNNDLYDDEEYDLISAHRGKNITKNKNDTGRTTLDLPINHPNFELYPPNPPVVRVKRAS